MVLYENRRRRRDFLVSRITKKILILLISFLADGKIWVRFWLSSISGQITPGVGPVAKKFFSCHCHVISGIQTGNGMGHKPVKFRKNRAGSSSQNGEG